MAAIQFLLDGGHETPGQVTTGTLSEFRSVSILQGGLIRLSDASRILGVSPQRVSQLADAGTLESWNFFGVRYVSATAVAERLATPRLRGRPRNSELQAA